MSLSKSVSKSTSDGITRPERALKIAILLPSKADLRKVRRAALLARELLSVELNSPRSIEVAIGLAQPDEKLWRESEDWIRREAPSVIVRHLDWTNVPVENARRMFTQLPASLDLEGIDQVVVPRDWGWNFQDCDFWINFADPGLGAVLPLRPVVHYCGDLAERYVPDAVASNIHDPYWTRQTAAFRLWRQGLVITADPHTAKDLISYAGVRRERIEIVPDILDTLPSAGRPNKSNRQPDSLLWLLRGNALDDLDTALHGLAIYRREGGRLDIQAVLSSDHREHPSIDRLGPDSRKLFEELPQYTYRSLDELDRMIVRAGALWSSQIAGGEAEHVHDAARVGLPLVAPDYPINRQSIERLNADAILYPAGNGLAIADALFELERWQSGRAAAKRKALPVDTEARRAEFGFLVDRVLEQRYGR